MAFRLVMVGQVFERDPDHVPLVAEILGHLCGHQQEREGSSTEVDQDHSTGEGQLQ